MRRDNPLIVALDVSDLDEAERLAAILAGEVAMLKIGLELFTSCGPEAVIGLRSHAPVFLDLKFHDIPNTVARAARNAGRLGVSMITVHSLGGTAMVSAAVAASGEGAEAYGFSPPRVAAVTVLSSLGGESLASPASLAFEATEGAGATAVVVSGEDVRSVREVVAPEVALVVPGIRPAGAGDNDHARVLTPEEAIGAGADYVVVGRPITGSPDPLRSARSILATLR